jgi:hypothetical protein
MSFRVSVMLVVGEVCSSTPTGLRLIVCVCPQTCRAPHAGARRTRKNADRECRLTGTRMDGDVEIRRRTIC